MHETLTILLRRIDTLANSCSSIIKWGSPVPTFGDPSSSVVATVGLNPSDQEFVDDSGLELSGPRRRFHTLNSLGLKCWSDADGQHVQKIVDTCYGYFNGNPYNRWFKPLDQLIAGTKASFYSKLQPACHLDLVPYATTKGWAKIDKSEREYLLRDYEARKAFGCLLRDSPIRVLILNGQSVVEQFQDLSRTRLQLRSMPAWSLQYSGRVNTGLAYIGTSDAVAGVSLDRTVLVLGYNHNIQSTPGVTLQARAAIQDWIAQETRDSLLSTEHSMSRI